MDVLYQNVKLKALFKEIWDLHILLYLVNKAIFWVFLGLLSTFELTVICLNAEGLVFSELRTVISLILKNRLTWSNIISVKKGQTQSTLCLLQKYIQWMFQ